MKKNIRKVLASIILTTAILISFLPTSAFAADDFNTAETLTLNELHIGTIENEGDVNYYKFTTSNNDSFYKIELRNTEVTERIKLTLYSGDDATTDIDDFLVFEADAKSDTIKLEPNHNYYISVQKDYFECTGNYKLGVTEIIDDVPDNYSKSTTIPLNKKKTFKLDDVKDADYFKFTTSSNDSYYKIELANTEATDEIAATVFYENDVTTDENEIPAYKARIGSNIVKLEPNHTYYVVVKAYTDFDSPTGAYKLCINEIKDDASDSIKNSAKISLNKKNSFKLNVDGDIDYFKFKASKSGTYTVTLANKTGNDGINAIIYSEADVTQRICTITSYKATKNAIKIKLKKNHTYYISVVESYNFYSGTGEYSLTIKK